MCVALLSAVVGAVAASVLACVPGLHVYNVMGLLVLALHGQALAPDVLVPAVIGMMVGFSLLSTVPSVLLAAPDESALFTVLPGQKYLMQGRGREGVLITATGGLAALFVLVVGFGPLAPRLLPAVQLVLRPHLHWMIWCVIGFMLLSEWPKVGPIGQGGWHRFLGGWRSLAAGLLTFGLSGLFGFILMFRPPVSHEVAFQNLMPAFVGLFTLPWLILNLISAVAPPPQDKSPGMRKLGAGVVLRGTLAGVFGGGFAAFVPAVTGGVGGFLAGHATAVRDDRVFLVSQGASKLTYYVGGLLLFFVPGLGLTRGGAAWLMRGFREPGFPGDYGLALASVALAGAVAFLLVSPLTRATIWLLERCGYRRLSWAALACACIVVFGMTGWMGLFVAVVGTGIGLIPVLFGSRRMNCLGVILLPLACNLSGFGARIAGWMRLV